MDESLGVLYSIVLDPSVANLLCHAEALLKLALTMLGAGVALWKTARASVAAGRAAGGAARGVVSRWLERSDLERAVTGALLAEPGVYDDERDELSAGGVTVQFEREGLGGRLPEVLTTHGACWELLTSPERKRVMRLAGRVRDLRLAEAAGLEAEEDARERDRVARGLLEARKKDAPMAGLERGRTSA